MTAEISLRKPIQIADAEFVHHTKAPFRGSPQDGSNKKKIADYRANKEKMVVVGGKKYLICEMELQSSDLTSSQDD